MLGSFLLLALKLIDMAKFIEGNDLNAEISKIFREAKRTLIIISPFIKLHERFKFELESKKKDPEFGLVLVFGKNEENITKSIGIEDIEFFKSFSNVEIRYEKRLHAKYYSSENKAILTSMNLYSFSQDNNIEAGISFETDTLLKDLASNITGHSIDKDAWAYFVRVIEQSELLFQKEPQYESKLLGLSKKYTQSKILIDKLNNSFRTEDKNKNNYSNTSKDNYNKTSTYHQNVGYCIRSGEEIPFNPNKPMSNAAYHTWAQFENPDYEENYCHKTGKPSYGRTSMRHPIL
jgi:hypothetical protein